jgi:hypothetical protein
MLALACAGGDASPQARQILRKLLPSPLRFTRHDERVKGYFEFEGQAISSNRFTVHVRRQIRWVPHHFPDGT